MAESEFILLMAFLGREGDERQGGDRREGGEGADHTSASSCRLLFWASRIFTRSG